MFPCLLDMCLGCNVALFFAALQEAVNVAHTRGDATLVQMAWAQRYIGGVPMPPSMSDLKTTANGRAVSFCEVFFLPCLLNFCLQSTCNIAQSLTGAANNGDVFPVNEAAPLSYVWRGRSGA